MLRLKLRTDREQIISINGTEPISSLKSLIQETTGFKHFTLKSGFPLKQLTFTDSQLIQSLIQSNSTILVSQSQLIILSNVPSDNSCLFHSIIKCLNLSESITQLRQLIATEIVKFTDFVSDIEEYKKWIVGKDSWGGGLELSVFANYFQVIVSCVDVQSQRIDKFYPSIPSTRTIYLLYSGIHYDAMISPSPSGSSIFDTNDDINELDKQVKLIAKSEKESGRFVDLEGFNLKCHDCNTKLRGERDATMHAKDTGHVNFVEFK